jgi:hypothetical protein
MVTQRFSAALMGDLVQSERTASMQQLHRSFNAAIEHQNQESREHLVSPLTITLGDEFQGLSQSLTSAMAITRDLRFRLLSSAIECRFAIGLVQLRTPPNPAVAWNMMGPGFGRTREKLNEKRAGSVYRFALTDDPFIEKMLEALGAGITAIERSWTEQQRHDIIALLAGATPAEIAKRRNVSVHSVYKVRTSGNFDVYVTQWHAIHEALARIDALHGMS